MSNIRRTSSRAGKERPFPIFDSEVKSSSSSFLKLNACSKKLGKRSRRAIKSWISLISIQRTKTTRRGENFEMRRRKVDEERRRMVGYEASLFRKRWGNPLGKPVGSAGLWTHFHDGARGTRAWQQGRPCKQQHRRKHQQQQTT